MAEKKIEHVFIDSVECKRCSTCQEFKPLTKFGKNNNKAYWDGLQNCCRDCRKKYKTDPKKRKQYWVNNRDILLEKKKEYKDKHRKEISQKEMKYKKERKRVDVGYRIRHNLGRRICYAINGKDKSKTTMELLGCSVDYLKKHLENNFTPEMTWDNYGTYWHVDHKIPCAEFDLSDPDQQKICFHYTNLQPMFWRDNLKKNRKLDWTIQ